MTWSRILLAIVLVDFAGLTAWTVWQHGFLGLFAQALGSAGGILLAVDLVIALSLIAVWLWRDARRQGVSPWPYLVLGAFTGSVGPLLYLLRRPAASDAGV